MATELNHKICKYMVFDTGIMQRFLQLDVSNILLGKRLTQINKESIADVFVGLEIVKSMPCHQPSQLYYWQREQRGSHAEIDYIVQQDRNIIPIEVKAGTKGAMQSLHLFMKEKAALQVYELHLKTSDVWVIWRFIQCMPFPIYSIENKKGRDTKKNEQHLSQRKKVYVSKYALHSSFSIL